MVLPSQPGLHLVVDRPQGPGAPLIASMAADALQQGLPVIPILVDQATPQFRAELARRGVDVDAAEARGDLIFVDAFSVRVGWAHTNPYTVFVEQQGPDAILLGLSEAQSGIVERASEHMVLVDSLSTLLVLEGLPPTYALVQSLSSLAPRLGSITVGRVIHGMHGSQEHTSLMHLATTVTDVSRDPQTGQAGTERTGWARDGR